MTFPKWLNRNFIATTFIGGLLCLPTMHAITWLFLLADWSEWSTWQFEVLYFGVHVAAGAGLGGVIGLTVKRYLHLRKVRKGMKERAKKSDISLLQNRGDESVREAMYFPKTMRIKKSIDHS